MISEIWDKFTELVFWNFWSSYFLKIFNLKMLLFCFIYIPWNILNCQRRKLLLTLIILPNFYMPCSGYAILYMLDPNFCVWLWPQPNWWLRIHFFYKQPVYKQLALGQHIASNFEVPNPLSVRNNKNCRSRKSGVFPCNKT